MPHTVVALPRPDLAALAPTYEAMCELIARCEKLDEVAKIADVAVAAQAYYRQSLDVDNEMRSSRIRVRAERRLGEILKRMRENGERASPNGEVNQHTQGVASRNTLADLGIPRDRASRAMQLADVPAKDFEAALTLPQMAQPRRILQGLKSAEHNGGPPGEIVVTDFTVPIEATLSLWGRVRDFGELLESGELPPLQHWRSNLQAFQLDHLRRFLPSVIAYLSAIQQEL